MHGSAGSLVIVMGMAQIWLSAAGAAEAELPSNQRVTPSGSAAIERQLDLVYADYGGRQLRLDLFLPREAPRPLPAVVVVHGGGWQKGDRTKFHALAEALALRGYAAAVIEYRLSPEAKFPAAIHDCNAAVRYLRAHATQIGIDPDRIAAVGGSAGGHLVALMAAAPHVDSLQGNGGNPSESSRLQAVVVMAGPLQLDAGAVADKSRTDPDANANLWLGKTVDQAPELYRLASPLSHLSKDAPPFLFQSGEHDRPERNAAAREKLRQLDVPAELRVYRHGKHGCWNQVGWFEPMVEDIDQFLRRSLKLPPAQHAQPGWSDEAMRVERKGDWLLLHLDKLPENRIVSLPRLTCPIGAVCVAPDCEAPLALRPGIQRWEIPLPAAAIAPLTLQIETKASALPWSLPPVVSTDPSGRLVLPAHLAETDGQTLRYEPQPHKNTLGYWVNEKDSAQWLIYLDRPSRYRVVVSQGCGKGQGGSESAVIIDEQQKLTWTVVETGHFQKFQDVAVGEVELESGLHVVKLQPQRKQAKAVMDVRQVVLEPLDRR